MSLQEWEEPVIGAVNSLDYPDEQVKTVEQYKSCKATPDYEKFHRDVWPVVDLISFSVAPFIIMIICNLLIGFKICHIRLASGHHQEAVNDQTRILSGMTLIMVACSLTFFALTFPSTVYIFYRVQWGSSYVIFQQKNT